MSVPLFKAQKYTLSFNDVNKTGVLRDEWKAAINSFFLMNTPGSRCLLIANRTGAMLPRSLAPSCLSSVISHGDLEVSPQTSAS